MADFERAFDFDFDRDLIDVRSFDLPDLRPILCRGVLKLVDGSGFGDIEILNLRPQEKSPFSIRIHFFI